MESIRDGFSSSSSGLLSVALGSAPASSSFKASGVLLALMAAISSCLRFSSRIARYVNKHIERTSSVRARKQPIRPDLRFRGDAEDVSEGVVSIHFDQIQRALKSAPRWSRIFTTSLWLSEAAAARTLEP